MPLFKGSASPTTFIVVDEQKASKLSMTKLLEQLELHRFKPVDKSIGRYDSWGWVNPESPASKQLDIPNVSGFIILSMRADLTRVSSSDLRFLTKQRVSEECSARNLVRLPKKEKMEIEDEVREELKKKTPPKRHIVQIAWDIDNARLFVHPLGAGVGDCLADLLDDTFGVEIMKEHVYTECVRVLGKVEGVGFFNSYGADALVEKFLPWVDCVIEDAAGDVFIGVGPAKFGMVFTDRVRLANADGSTMDFKTRDALRHGASQLVRDQDYTPTLAKTILFCDEFSVDAVIDAPKWTLSSLKLPKKYEGSMGRYDVLERRLGLLADIYQSRTSLFARYLREQFGVSHAKS